MSLHLDKRQRAMLAEMGVPLWTPPESRLHRVGVRVSPEPVQARAAGPADRVPALPRGEPVRVSGAALPAAAASTARSPLPAGVNGMDWSRLEAAVAACRACGLCDGRTQTVFGVGDRQADWMVVGEAPGRNEDRVGEPFVGQAGKLLDNMLAAVGLSRHVSAQTPASVDGPQMKGVYIANVVKCRPPGNRNPQPDEIATCEPYLQRQIALVQPKIIIAMGRFAVQSLLGSSEPIGRLRGRIHAYQQVPLVVTYHPAYLLRSLAAKGKAWHDLCLALSVAHGQAGAGGQ